jgi:UDP-N-acetylmuramate-alanine ligase
VLEEIKQHKKEVIVTMGAGDIDALIEPLEKILRN